MAKIYSRADQVPICLGEDTDNGTVLAFQLIRDINSHFGNEYIKIANNDGQEARPVSGLMKTINDIPVLPDDGPLLTLSRWGICKKLLARS